jgi:propionyl-CoA synthetase
MSAYEEAYRRSLEDPEGFWGDASRLIDWNRQPDRILDHSNPPFTRWFVGGELNTCYNALDRHVERGRSDQLALIYDSPATGQVQRFTYRELKRRTQRPRLPDQ